jgi:hypothetical protein
MFILESSEMHKYKQTNSVVSVRKRTIPTERPPLVGEVSANFSGKRVSRGQRNESPRPLISVTIGKMTSYLIFKHMTHILTTVLNKCHINDFARIITDPIIPPSNFAHILGQTYSSSKDAYQTPT